MTSLRTAGDLRLEALDRALVRGADRLLELQRPDGHWCGELESNVTMTAQHLFWHHFLGLRTPELDRKIANELLARRREDGTWAIWLDGPADLNTTIEAYAALKLAGVDPGTRTREFIALIGQWPWQRVPPILPEMILLPPGGPLSVYDFACWARQTLVALSVVRALRPARIDLREIGGRPGETKPPPRPSPLRKLALQRAEQWVRDRQEADGSWG